MADHTKYTIKEDIWPDAAVKHLLTLFGELKPLVDQKRIKSLEKVWSAIAEQMETEGYNYHPSQIKNKWKTLVRGYKKVFVHGNKAATCSYQNELSEMLGDMYSNIELESDITTHQDEAQNTADDIMLFQKLSIPSPETDTDFPEEEDEEDEEAGAGVFYTLFEPQTPTPNPKPSLRRLPRSVVHELQGLRKDMADEREKRDEARREREESRNKLLSEQNRELKRKNDLFEEYLTLLKVRKENGSL